MSVILDALQKARGDRQKNQAEPNPNSVARVLEPITAPAAEAAPARKSGKALTAVVMLAMLLLFALAGGGFYLLYQQMQRLQPQQQGTVAAPIVPPAGMDPGTIATPSIDAELAVSPASLPPPVPLSDLPIQPPEAAHPASAGKSTSAELPVASPSSSKLAQVTAPPSNSSAPLQPATPEFKLGSIVCENNICMALINGRTTRVGDKIKGYVVAEITDKGVLLKSEAGAGEVHLDLYN